MGPTRVFSSGYGRVLTVLMGVVAVVIVAGVATAGEARLLVLAVAASALAALLTWALFWRPRVEVSDGGVLIVNVLRTIEAPWPVVDRAEAGWSLVVHTLTGRWTAWAAPQGSAVAAARRARAGRGPLSGTVSGTVSGTLSGTRTGSGPERHGARPERATAEAVAAAVEERRTALVAAGHLDGARRAADAHGLRETVTWHLGTIAAAVALAAVTVVAAAAS